MIRCKEVLLRKDWRIINLLHVAGLQEDGPNKDGPLLKHESMCTYPSPRNDKVQRLPVKGARKLYPVP